MQWLTEVVDELVKRKPTDEILIESGGSPSGTYHLGHLRELVTSDAILQELRRRGHSAKHVYYVDDLDALRKIPVNVPSDFEQYLGRPLYVVPAPDGSDKSYADYFLQDLIDASKALGVEVEFIRTHQKYQAGAFAPAIERTLQNADKVRKVLEDISGHRLGGEWSPVQVNEDGYLKKRRFLALNEATKVIDYEDRDGQKKTISYATGHVKLDWRIDWPARWWLLKVDAEPFGRDHATKGGSYDTGAALAKAVFESEPPLPVPYDFVNMVGDTKKMSASKGTGLDAARVVNVLPAEIIRFFMLRYAPRKRLYFDPAQGVAQLIDDYAELMSSQPDSLLLQISQSGTQPMISRIPFSHLVASYQAALKNIEATLAILQRTGYREVVEQNRQILYQELAYIDRWLNEWAPDDIKFELVKTIAVSKFNQQQRMFLNQLAEKVAAAPPNADGEWFHKAIYDLKDKVELDPKELFTTLYQALIGKDAGPRAGWFLSMLPRDWLLKRLRLEA